MKKPHVLVLFSDTGGGHRSASEAIIEALGLEFGESITTEMVDFFKEYAPIPFNKMPELYPQLVKAPQLWGAGFYATDGRARARVLTNAFRPYATRAAKKLLANHPSDVIVTTHLAANSMGLWAPLPVMACGFIFPLSRTSVILTFSTSLFSTRRRNSVKVILSLGEP